VGLALHMAAQLPMPGQSRWLENMVQDGERVKMSPSASSTVFNLSCAGNYTFKEAAL